MPVHNNHIGSHNFVDLTGAIFYRQQQLEIIERAGVAGSGVRRLGVRGKTFELVSVAFHASFSAAATALQTYDDLPGTAAVEVMRNSIDHGDYLVLEVTEIETVAVYNVIGSVSPSDQVRQQVRWKLLG